MKCTVLLVLAGMPCLRTTTEKIKAATEALQKEMMDMGSAMYQQAGAAGSAKQWSSWWQQQQRSQQQHQQQRASRRR